MTSAATITGLRPGGRRATGHEQRHQQHQGVDAERNRSACPGRNPTLLEHDEQGRGHAARAKNRKRMAASSGNAIEEERCGWRARASGKLLSASSMEAPGTEAHSAYRARVAVLKSILLPVVIERMDTRNSISAYSVTLEALLAERNVTRAAQRLKPEPTRLVRPAGAASRGFRRSPPHSGTARDGLNQRAVELRQPLHEALEGVRRVVADGAPFDPATMQATLVIAATTTSSMRCSPGSRSRSGPKRPRSHRWRALDVLALATQLERGEVDWAWPLQTMHRRHAPASALL